MFLRRTPSMYMQEYGKYAIIMPVSVSLLRYGTMFYGLRKGRCIMFRIWAKIFKDNRLVKDTVICDGSDDTRTHKVFRALDEIIYQFDLGKPIWLDATVTEFQRHAKARFTQDNFVESVDFDYLELHVIEED